MPANASGQSRERVTNIDDFVLPPEPEWVYTKVRIYTDGACSGNPGAGGWGALIRYQDGKEEELYGSEAHTTNNRMELSAALHALRHLQSPSRVEVVTDSRYLKDGICTWLKSWKEKKWRTASGRPVKNRDLWEALEHVSRWHRVEWSWVEGHSGHVENERADFLARKGAKEASLAGK